MNMFNEDPRFLRGCGICEPQHRSDVMNMFNEDPRFLRGCDLCEPQTAKLNDLCLISKS